MLRSVHEDPGLENKPELVVSAPVSAYQYRSKINYQHQNALFYQ